MTTNTSTEVQTSASPSEGTKVHQPAMPGALRPRWCVQRDGNTVVPLIAMDELPDSVFLKDVPTTLTLLEALRARMELIPGDHPAHGIRYQLDQPINTRAVVNEEGDDSGSDGSSASGGSESSTQRGVAAPNKKGDQNAAGNMSEGSKDKDKLPVRVHSPSNISSLTLAVCMLTCYQPFLEANPIHQ